MRVILFILLFLSLAFHGCQYSRPWGVAKKNIYSTNSNGSEGPETKFIKELRSRKRSGYKHGIWYNCEWEYSTVKVFNHEGILIRKKKEKDIPGFLDHRPPPNTKLFEKETSYTTNGKKANVSFFLMRCKRYNLNKIIVDKEIQFDEKGRKTVIRNARKNNPVFSLVPVDLIYDKKDLTSPEKVQTTINKKAIQQPLLEAMQITCTGGGCNNGNNTKIEVVASYHQRDRIRQQIYCADSVSLEKLSADPLHPPGKLTSTTVITFDRNERKFMEYTLSAIPDSSSLKKTYYHKDGSVKKVSQKNVPKTLE